MSMFAKGRRSNIAPTTKGFTQKIGLTNTDAFMFDTRG